MGYASGRALRLDGIKNNQIIGSFDQATRIIVNLHSIARSLLIDLRKT